MPDQAYIVTSTAWYPSGDQHSALVYEASAPMPDFCSGGLVRLGKGGFFTASITSP
jgi:hypothetical protein